MTRFAGFLSLLAGLIVLIGYFFPDLNRSYFLVLIGGTLAIIAGFIGLKKPKNSFSI